MFIREGLYNGQRFNRFKRSLMRIALIILALGGPCAAFADRKINAGFLSGAGSLMRSVHNHSAQDYTAGAVSSFNPAGAQVFLHVRGEPSLVLKGLFMILASSRGYAVSPMVNPWGIRPPVWWLIEEQPSPSLEGS